MAIFVDLNLWLLNGVIENMVVVKHTRYFERVAAQEKMSRILHNPSTVHLNVKRNLLLNNHPT